MVGSQKLLLGPNYSETSDKGHSERGQTRIQTLYKITSERGQPLYKGQNAGSQSMSTLRGSTDRAHNNVVVSYKFHCINNIGLLYT